MSGPPLPPAAKAFIAEYVAESLKRPAPTHSELVELAARNRRHERDAIRAVAADAAAAERERIRQLAIDVGAEYAGPPHPCRCHDGACQLTIRDRIPFATLLDAPTAPAIPTEGTTS